MYSEDDLISISAIQHVMFCERQYALIHIEQLWEENRFTAEGRVLHERVDREHHESRRLHKTEYGMAIRSLEHGLIGKADVVEFEKHPAGGYCSIIPLEFKRGRNKDEDWDRVQLCAQAFCLEHMFGAKVHEGQIYYLQEHRRTTVELTKPLRARTTELVNRIRELADSAETPSAVHQKQKCDRCSMYDLCMPKAVDRGGKSVARYVTYYGRVALQDDCI